MTNCPNCGAPVALETAHCPYCGTPYTWRQLEPGVLERMAEANRCMAGAIMTPNEARALMGLPPK